MTGLFDSEKFIPFTDAQMARLKQSYLAGETTRSLAKVYGISPCTVRRRLLIMDVTLRPQGREPRVTPEVLATASAMRAQGKPWKDIGQKTGVKVETIMCAMRRGKKWK